ncbi:MAG TPA: antitoxin VbhA family protein [Nevskia sp.]|nr:antitoxin VbhA family protein [Nevskia sp.]
MAVLDARERQARRDALAKAGRSCEIEGLPPPSEMALALYERWIDGELTGDEVAALLTAHYTRQAQD